MSCSPGGLHLFSLVLGLLWCWFFPGLFLVPTRVCSFRHSLSLRLPSCRGLLFGRVHGSSRYFSFFLFLRFCALPSSLVGLVLLFFLQAVVSIFRHFFRLVRLFSDLPMVVSLLIPQGPPLGSCSLLSGSAQCVLLWVSLGLLAVRRSSKLFFGGFPLLPVFVSPFSPVACSPSVVRYCFLPRSLRPLPTVVAVVFPFG